MTHDRFSFLCLCNRRSRRADYCSARFVLYEAPALIEDGLDRATFFTQGQQHLILLPFTPRLRHSIVTSCSLQYLVLRCGVRLRKPRPFVSRLSELPRRGHMSNRVLQMPFWVSQKLSRPTRTRKRSISVSAHTVTIKESLMSCHLSSLPRAR